VSWIVDYADGWEKSFGEMPLGAARRAMRLVSDFSDRPAEVDFEIVFNFYLRLYSEDLKGWRVVVVLVDPFVRVLGAVRYA
jgi:hypothetical protein